MQDFVDWMGKALVPGAPQVIGKCNHKLLLIQLFPNENYRRECEEDGRTYAIEPNERFAEVHRFPKRVVFAGVRIPSHPLVTKKVV
jgi:hypothetical protein